LRVTKASRDEDAVSDLVQLDVKARVEELARMLGGAEITAKTRAHAKELYEQSRRM
jgi:DNA repair protein RecN (Recombination protein N)